MPTNKERRDVAARLREKHGERQGTFEPQSMSIQAMNRMDDLLDCLPKRRDMFLDLADLIEPEHERTCKNVYDEMKMGACDNGFECSECGEKVEDCEGYHVKGTWNYCPGCGAKVVG